MTMAKIDEAEGESDIEQADACFHSTGKGQ